MESEQDSNRWNFTPKTIKKVQQRAAFICSNPDCRLMTVGPSLKDDDQVQYAGKVAHILPASKGGPRDIVDTTSNRRTSMKNAIFLCGSCADIIDKNNGIDHPIKLLQNWKKEHVNWVSEHLNKQLANHKTNITIHNDGGIAVGIQHNYFHPSVPEPDKKFTHDSDLFKRLDLLLNENKLVCLLKRLLDFTKMSVNEQDFLTDASTSLKQFENKYLSTEIDTTVVNLTENLDSLNSFIDSRYDMFPYDQKKENYIIDFMPEIYRRHELNVSRDEYEKGDIQLLILTKNITAVITAYQNYRNCIKQILFI